MTSIFKGVRRHGARRLGGVLAQAALVAFGAGRGLGAGWEPGSFPVGLDGSRVYSALMADDSGGVWLGGTFTQVGNVPAQNIARWNGSAWQALRQPGTPGVDGVNGPVLALARGADGSVFVGGAFSMAGDVPAWNVARWDGTSWGGLGGGLMAGEGGPAAVVRALAVDAQGRVYAGGTFGTAGGVAVENLAVWDGQRWNLVPGGGVRSLAAPAATIHALAWRGSHLWVGGAFDQAGDVAASGLAEWDGARWTSPGGGVGFPGFQPFVKTLRVRGNDVFVGGRFTHAGGVEASNVARWNGTAWNPLGVGTDGGITSLQVLGPDVIAAGGFLVSGATPTPGLARWDGVAWQALDGGVGGPEPVVTAVAADAGGLWVAGTFATAGGRPAERSARWSPANLPPVGRVTSPTAGTRILVPSANSTTRVALALEARDPDGRIASVEWFDGTTRLGLADAPPFAWEVSDVVRGTHWYWARLHDDTGSFSETAPVDVEVDTPNAPPVVRIDAPATGSLFNEGDRIAFRAVASDPGGRVVRVEFIDGSGKMLSALATGPFEHVLASATPGTWNLRAVATDDRGARTTSEPVVVRVNARPIVRITAPTDGAAFVVTNEVKIVVEAADADGRVERLTLLRDGVALGSTTSEPYRFALVNVPAGTNTYRVLAMDDAGALATSAPVVIQHQAVPLPYAKPRTYLAVEGDTANLVAPAALALRAETVTQPPYFQFHQFVVSGAGYGPVVLDNTYRTTNPARLVVSNLAAGTYEFRAVGIDLFGATATSAPVSVTVRAPATPVRYRLAVTAGLGGNYPTPTALGPDGTVVGYSDLVPGSAAVHGFRWNAGVLTDLTPDQDRAEAWDINGSGTVLGLATVGDPGWNGMFLLDAKGGLRKASGLAVLPRALNAQGHVVGRTRPGMEPSRPFLWRGTGAPEVLGDDEGEALDIDGRGRVVGWRRSLREPSRAFLWDDGFFTTLSLEASEAWGINEAGQIVGVVGESDPERRAVMWDQGEVRVLGTLPGHNATAAAINAGGTVVGWGRPTGSGVSDRAMLWKDGVAHDLNGLVEGAGNLQLRRAVAVNDAGQVAGIAVDPTTWRTMAFLATPTSMPEPQGTAPMVQWNAPEPGAVQPRVGTPLEWSVDATDAEGPVTRVEFRVGHVVVATATAAPFRTTWVPTVAGPACLAVAAWDAGGRVTVTSPRCLEVLPAPAPFDVVDVGPAAGTDSGATGINARGDIVGFTRDDSFLDVAGVVTPLRWVGLTQAVAIADDQTVAVRDGMKSALYRAGSFRALPFLSTVVSETGLRALNGRGVAVGWGMTETRRRRAVRFADGVLRDLGTLPGHEESDAFGINDAGVVVGWSFRNGEAKAVQWDAAGVVEALPGLAGYPVSRATAIHASGAVAGVRMDASSRVEGALWTEDGVAVIRDLGIGGVEPSAVDRLRRVVGSASGRAFLWATNQTHDLNTLVPPGSGWLLQAALAMNDAGQIVGVGQRTAGDPTPRAFLLQPNPAVQTQFSHQPPVVDLTWVDANTTRIAGDAITLQAAVRTQSGVIDRVSFFEDGRWVGDVMQRPYRWTASNRPAGTSLWTAVASDRFPSRSTSAPVAVVVQALPTNAPRVAVIGVGGTASVPWVQAALRRTLRFSAVDGFTATTAAQVPPAGALASHDVLLLHGHGVATVAEALGPLIAGRVAEGVGLVAAQHAGAGTALAVATGPLVADGWLPWSATGNRTQGGATMSAMLPGHPLMEGVARLKGGTDLLLMDGVRVAPGGVEVARWSGGTPLAVAREVGRARTVGLNLFPAPVGERFDSWEATGDGLRLIANALAWAARDATRTNAVALAVEPPSSAQQPFYLPGEVLRLMPTTGMATSWVSRVQWFTNGVAAGTWQPGSGPLMWSNAPVGQHRLTLVVEQADGTRVASPSVTARVDSRMTAAVVSPANGGFVTVPGTLEVVVGVTNLDAPVVRVEFLRDGTERLGTVTNAPYTWRYTVGVGAQNLSARVTDALGAVRVTETVRVTAYNPSSPQVTSWRGGTNAWGSTNGWSAGVPRAQDRALIDGGRALLGVPGGFASNVVVGTSGAGVLRVDGAALRVGKALALGDGATGSGELQVSGGGSVTVAALAIGVNGSGSVVQESGTVTVTTTEVSMGANPGSRGSYTLANGLLVTRGLSVWGTVGDPGFVQLGGTNRVNGFLVVGPRSGRTGMYRMEGGLLETAGLRVASGRAEPASLEVLGGRLNATGPVTVGTEGTGRFVVRGGEAVASSWATGTSGTLELLAREGSVGLTITGEATLRGRLVVRLDPAIVPELGREIPLMRYGSVLQELSAIDLPAGRDGIAWGMEFRASEAVLVARPATTEVVVSPVEDGMEPGVFTRLVRVSNPGKEPLRGLRIYVPGLPETVELLNKSGAEDGVAYVEVARAVGPGASVEVTLQFLSRETGRPVGATAVLAVEDATTATATRPPLLLSAPAWGPDGTVRLRFDPEPGVRYAIEYSGDLARWERVPQTLLGTGGGVAWDDAGPPKTRTPPGTGGPRFYRVVPANP